MKKFLNMVSLIIITGIVILILLGTGLSNATGEPLETGTVFVYISFLFIFIFAIYGSFFKKNNSENVEKINPFFKILYYCTLSIGLFTAIVFAALYFLES